MNVHFDSALAAAAQAASGQHYPSSALYVVATPIGNLADMSLRAMHVLQIADCIACEDTRHTQTLLRAYGIEKAGHQLLALHQHNEAQAAQGVIDQLRLGKRIVYVSDAGTPGISDPGGRLVAAVQQQQLRTVPIPGVSSVTALLSVAGVVQEREQGFNFIGFLPSKAGEREQAVAAIDADCRPVVVLEAPHRIQALAGALSTLGARKVTVGRELTKQFEEIATLAAHDLPQWLAQDANRLRGEFVLAVHAKPPENTAQDNRVLEILLQYLPLKTAVKVCADITGQARNILYQMALAIKSAHPDQAVSEMPDGSET